MHYFRRNRFIFSFLLLLVFCTVMVVRQYRINQARHVELREAFILLYTKGYKKESTQIYQRLLKDIEHLSNQRLMDDFQRTLLLVDPTADQPENLIWKYHWTVSKQLELRSESTLKRALKLAEEK